MSLSRFGQAVTITACALLWSTCAGAAGPEKRQLNLHNVNTHEDLNIIYKVNGAYDPAAIKKLEWFFRDWRLGKTRNMDPKVFDLLSMIYEATGSSAQINVHSGYRSEETNAFLRTNTRGVAKESQHIEGKAIDFHIPGVPTKRIRELALKFQGGGVGYYPASRSPFVHIDVADVRAWPRPSRALLASLFPDGKTAHIPSDGKPMPGYDEALAEIKGRKLGIMAVIGNIADFVKPKTQKARSEPEASELAFVAPIPSARPEMDPATAFMLAPHGVAKIASRKSVGAPNPLFVDPLAFIEAQRKLVRDIRPIEVAEVKPVVFETVEVEKSGRHLNRK